MARALMTVVFFFFQAEDGIRDKLVTGVQTCALPISRRARHVGGPRHGGAADQGEAPPDPKPDRHWDVAGARYQHGDTRDAVVARRLDPGRQRERGTEVGPHARGLELREAAVPGPADPPGAA